MTNLTAAEPRTFRGPASMATHEASGAVWEGSALQFDGSGQLQNLTGAGTSFAGFGDESADAAADRINVRDEGVVQLTVTKATNFAATDHQAIVYGSDGNTFTLTSTSNQKIGRIVEIASGIGSTTAVCWVYFRSAARQLDT